MSTNDKEDECLLILRAGRSQKFNEAVPFLVLPFSTRLQNREKQSSSIVHPTLSWESKLEPQIATRMCFFYSFSLTESARMVVYPLEEHSKDSVRFKVFSVKSGRPSCSYPLYGNNICIFEFNSICGWQH